MPRILDRSCLLRIAFALSLMMISGANFAGLTYTFRDSGTSNQVASIEVNSPPADSSEGWSSVDIADLLALIVEGEVLYGPGSPSGLSGPGIFDLTSTSGNTIDGGQIALNFLPILPGDPLTDPVITRSLSMTFDSAVGGDFLAVSTTLEFPDGRKLVGDLFVEGDAVLAISEPTTLYLSWIVLLVPAIFARKSRRRTGMPTGCCDVRS